MKKIFISLFITGIIIFTVGPIIASAPAATPRCIIEGVIKSVEFSEAHDNPCVADPLGCPSDTPLHYPARYELNIRIDSASYVSGTTEYNTCENMIPAGSEKNIYINEADLDSGDVFAAGQKIKGLVSSGFGLRFEHYHLEKSRAELGGRWIKTADRPAIYHLDGNGVRHVYPLQKIWASHFGNDFSFIETIPASEMAGYPLGGNILFKSGTLVKIPSVPKVYLVMNNGVLKWIRSESSAKSWFGDGWASLVKDLPVSLFPTYAAEQCADYTRDGIVTEHCAICGDGNCEVYEECTSSIITCETPDECIATMDCGGLYCPRDCS